MKRFILSGLAACGALFLLGVPDAPGCGLCTPEFIKKVGVNIGYPDALHVEGAVWAAQKAKRLPMPDMKRLQATGAKRKVLDLMTLQKTVKTLQAFGALLLLNEDGAASGPERAVVSVLLVDEMMWNRFVPQDGKTRLLPDVKGPEKGDLVIVTETCVVTAISGASLSVAEAAEMGVLRLYGAPGEAERFLSRSGHPLADSVASGEKATGE